MAQRVPYAIFACLVLFFVVATAVWLALDRAPASWDDAYYLKSSFIVYDAFADGGLAGFVHQFLYGMKTKPPLIAVLPTPVYWIVGRRIRAAYAVNLFFMVVLFGSLFHLGKKYSGSRAGLLAVFVAGTMPMLYGLSHWFLVECGLTALVCAAIVIMAGLDERTRWSRCALLGAVFGLGLLMKMSFPVYVAVPMVYFAARNRNTVLKPKLLAFFAAPAALIAMPWYLVNFAPALHAALNAGSAGTAKAYATGGVLSWPDIRLYLGNLANGGPAIYFVLLGSVLFFTSRLPQDGRRGMLLCALWASPVLFLIFGHYRDLRYAAPLFPAVALGIGILIEFVASGRGIEVWGPVCALLLLSLVSMLHSSFGILGKRNFELGGLLLVEPRLQYARKYDRTAWPHQEILFDMLRASNLSNGRKDLVILGTDSVSFNADNFQLAATRARLPLEFGSTAYESDSALISTLYSASYFIYKDGGEAEAPNFNSLGGTAIREVRDGGRFRELPIARTLPDGGVAHVFKNEGARGLVPLSAAFLAAAFKEIEECNVTFAGRIQLTGYSARRTAQGLDVKLRWSCLKPVDRDYWCFVHMLDRSGKIVGYLDHQILNGNPSTRDWKSGDMAFEELLFPSQERPLRLRMGVFDRSSGERLPISSSQFPLADRDTAAILSEDTSAAK